MSLYLTNGRANWSYEDFEANDPKALENMVSESPDEYQTLLNKKIDTSIKDEQKRKNWTYWDYIEKDPAGLKVIEKYHRQKYWDLYNAHIKKQSV